MPSSIAVRKPSLVEPGTAESLSEALQECHRRRHEALSMTVNAVLCLGLLVLAWTILTYRQRHRVDPSVKEKQRMVAQTNLFAMLARYDRRLHNVGVW
jgi:sensor domain CHASE-containing protein